MPRNKYPEITVNRILDTAIQLFLKRGYEHTTIQDIVDALGDLSKGAIYHHFSSKDDIIEAALTRHYTAANQRMTALQDDRNGSGLERMRQMFLISLQNPEQLELAHTLPNLLQNPRFLAEQLRSTVCEIAPQYIQPLIEQGIADGSISGTHPKEMAEVLALLLNIWLNPAVFKSTAEELNGRVEFLQELLAYMGLPIFDGEHLKMVEQYRSLFQKED